MTMRCSSWARHAWNRAITTGHATPRSGGRAALTAHHLAALATLPLDYCLTFADAPPLRLLHGLPGNFFVGFRPDSPAGWASRHLATVSEGMVVGGRTHVPMSRWILRSGDGAGGQGWQVVNSGSAGAPYDGDPHVSYIWLEGDAGGWKASIRRMDYDREAVAPRACPAVLPGG